MRPIKEGDIVHQLLDYLWAKGIFAFQLGTGRFFGEHKGKVWAFKAHSLGRGASDILALPYPRPPHWIEAKRPGSTQSPAQKQFEIWVEEYGFVYLLASSIDDLKGIL